MWEAIAIVVCFGLVGGLGWLLVYLITDTQSGDRSYSDNDSGSYNDAG
jgi:hypothetical protein